ncbi:hypothetical protein IR127_09125, partial [Lactobacillus murinus]|nr:hypothetical protein [Ligilactobacillus murinus]
YANCGSKSVRIFGSQATDFSQWWLTDYDKLVHQYYDLRDTDRRVDEFTTQIGSKKLAAHKSSRDEIMAAIQDQGLSLD